MDKRQGAADSVDWDALPPEAAWGRLMTVSVAACRRGVLRLAKRGWQPAGTHERRLFHALAKHARSGTPVPPPFPGSFELEAEEHGHSEAAWCVAIAPGGRICATGGSDDRIVLWDLRSFTPVRTFVGHGHYVSALAFSPDGSILYSSCGDRTVRAWSVDADDPVLGILPCHRDWVTSLALSADGSAIVCGSLDGTISVIGTDGLRLVRAFEAHPGGVEAVAISPQGDFLASCGRDGRAVLWNLQSALNARSQPLPFAPLGPGSTLPTRLAFSADGRRLAMVAHRNAVVVWDVAARKCLRRDARYPTALAWHPDGSILAIGGEWSLEAEAVGHLPPFSAPIQADRGAPGASSLAFHPSGTRLLATCKYGMLRDWASPWSRLVARPVSELSRADRAWCDRMLATQDVPGAVKPWLEMLRLLADRATQFAIAIEAPPTEHPGTTFDVALDK